MFLDFEGFSLLEPDHPVDLQLNWIPLHWLGPKAVAGSWHRPEPGSYIDRGIVSNNRVIRQYFKAYTNMSGMNNVVKQLRSCSSYHVDSLYEDKFK
jgi:hypothetical protein